MSGLQITVGDASGRPDPALASELLADIDRNVAPTQFAEAEDLPGARGGLAAMATLAIGAVSSSGLGVLADVLKSHLSRNDAAEFAFEGPGGKLTLKGDLARAVSREQIAAMLAQVTAPPAAQAT